MRRFMGDGEEVVWMRKCVQQFREAIGYPLPDTIPTPEPFSAKLRDLQRRNDAFAAGAEEQQAIDHIIKRVEQVRAGDFWFLFFFFLLLFQFLFFSLSFPVPLRLFFSGQLLCSCFWR